MSQVRTNSLVPAGGIPAGASGGGIIQIVSATKTDTFSTSTLSYVDVTGLSVTITPSSSSSKIWLIGSMNASNQSNSIVFRFVRDSTAISLGDTAGSRPRGTTTSLRSSDNGAIFSYNMNFVDSPSSTSAITYKIQALTLEATTHVNRSVGDEDSSTRPRTTSTITVMEVSG